MKKIIRKVGVFDSGVGGLTVLRELKNLPIQEFVYVADTANLPYGEKTAEQIITFTTRVVAFLISHNVDAIVIACHTASALALEHVQKKFPNVLIIGVVDPVVQAACSTTKNKVIGVIGTPATIASKVHKTKIVEHLPAARVVMQACPRFVPLIEGGLRNKDELYDACREYLTPLQQAGCDTVIIGCTHYELILDEIDKFLEGKVALISAPIKTASALVNFCPVVPMTQVITYHVTGDVEQFRKNAEILMGLKLERVLSTQLSTLQNSDFSGAEHQDA
jgi:glutamate racemase